MSRLRSFARRSPQSDHGKSNLYIRPGAYRTAAGKRESQHTAATYKNFHDKELDTLFRFYGTMKGRLRDRHLVCFYQLYVFLIVRTLEYSLTR